MIQAGKMDLEGKEVDVISVKTANSIVLLIKAKNGMLGCGYFSTEAANKLGDALAIVIGVNSFEDMLKAQVTGVSDKAKELGIDTAMNGKEALQKMM